MKQLNLEQLKLEAVTARNHLDKITKLLEEETAKQQSKRIDISKLPDSTVVEVKKHPDSKKFLSEGKIYCSRLADGRYADGSQYSTSDCTLSEQKEFTVWLGGDCPLVDGVVYEVIHRDGSKWKVPDSQLNMSWQHSGEGWEPDEVIAYRIIGLAEGYSL